MRIFVDADACPVVSQTEDAARRHGVPVTLLCDTNHVLRSDYSEVKVIGAGADAVDFALANLCRAGDIVVTQDYGVAAMALGKRAYALHRSATWRRKPVGPRTGIISKGPASGRKRTTQDSRKVLNGCWRA